MPCNELDESFGAAPDNQVGSRRNAAIINMPLTHSRAIRLHCESSPVFRSMGEYIKRGKKFVFTAGEQEFYAEKGFQNEPQRCKNCRDARKAGKKAEREMFTAVCAGCGKEAKVPFRPREDRPVYCSECFAKMKEER